jgi:coenzyme F420-reducing hydrogenase delta subunit
VEEIQKILFQIGMEPERIQMYNLSSSMGPRFAEIATEMTERARLLGPNPLKNERGFEQPTEVEP